MDEQAIREKAHALWQKEGQPHGRDAEFWERARLMIESDAAPAPATSTPASGAKDKSDMAVEETFPASDPPSFTAPKGTKSGR